MSEPFALLPLALAAGGGSLASPAGEVRDARVLVAAGLTLLQRSALLVRALLGRRAAILLPNHPAYLVALAASEGRGALLLDPDTPAAEVAVACAIHAVGAVFTLAEFSPRVPPGVVTVLLNEAPSGADVVAGGRTRRVDLGSHHGLSVRGSDAVPGREEEVIVGHGSVAGTSLTHRELLHHARGIAAGATLGTADRVLALLPLASPLGIAAALAAPLLAGARLQTVDREELAHDGWRAVEEVTVVVADAAQLDALLHAPAARERLFRGALRLALSPLAPGTAELAERWRRTTAVPLSPLPDLDAFPATRRRTPGDGRGQTSIRPGEPDADGT